MATRGRDERTSEADAFRAGLAAAAPAPNRQAPSAARIRVRDAFAAIAAARSRGVSWRQIADLMAADGVRAADGAPLTEGAVKALFHVERYARGGRRKRRTGLAPDASAPRVRRRRQGAGQPAARVEQDARATTPAAAAADDDEGQRAADLRARVARRRPGLREPPPITLGPGDRRPTEESDEDG